ncbi:hypothetical protein HNR33_000546 [Brassicibacter mesophilus]
MKYDNKQGVPSLEEAKVTLKEAEKLNHGGWFKHSIARND